MKTSTPTLKTIGEIFPTLNDLVKFVFNGRILFSNNKGSVSASFYKKEYKLKKDTEMYHTDYGYKAETDWRLQREGVERKMTFPKGTIVCLEYHMYSNGIHWTVTTPNSYRKTSVQRFGNDVTERNENYMSCIKAQKHLIPENVEYNCINSAYIYVKNGKGITKK